jgi:hypothetical protein
MDIFDKFFKKFAYKFDKGYPDMNNSQDVLLLENILSKVMGKEIVLEAFNKSNSIKAAKDFVENSNFAKSNDVKRFTSGKYANRINSSKVKNFDQIKNALINHFNIPEDDIEKIDAGAGPAANDSVAGFLLKTKEFGEVYISVSIGKKGLGGKLNEKNFNNNINQYASKENPITVKLIASDKTLEYNNVARAEDVAGDTRNKLKADTALFSPSESKMPIANISLKQSEGFRWAALNNDDTDFRQKFLDAAFNNPNFPIELKPNPEFPGKERYEMFKKGTDQRVTLVIVTDAPYTKDPKNIFGNDNPKTVVVGRTFKPEDFKFDENTNTLDIKVDHIYEDLEEINGSPFEPVFIIAQHSGNPYGLDFRAYPKFMAKLPKKGTGIEIKYSDLIK